MPPLWKKPLSRLGLEKDKEIEFSDGEWITIMCKTYRDAHVIVSASREDVNVRKMKKEDDKQHRK